MKWQYTNDNISARFGDYIGEGFTGRIISPEEFLENKWYDTPTEAKAAKLAIVSRIEELKQEVENEETIESLTKKAEDLGIKVDKRWGVKKIQEAIDGKCA